ncbi:ATP-binding cassette sub-family B member 10, mitochondrial-like isoform X1 [Phyllobates terribilis]|uniref:ATP-binding cassette sub-family B member 10, mitochondrial-like isoform X1 n=1 Tax=Phyllobates terribilis TaxID=111132 RepID=UPI003CCAF7AC
MLSSCFPLGFGTLKGRLWLLYRNPIYAGSCSYKTFCRYAQKITNRTRYQCALPWMTPAACSLGSTWFCQSLTAARYRGYSNAPTSQGEGASARLQHPRKEEPGPKKSLASQDVRRLLSLAHPERWRLTGFSYRSYSNKPTSQGDGASEKVQDPREEDKGPKMSLVSQDVRRLLSLAHPERWRLTAAVGFVTVSSAISMSAPFFLGKVIDVIYSNPAQDLTSSLTSLCAVLSGVFLCGAVANGIRVYLMQTSGERIVRGLRSSLFSSLLRQEVGFFDKTRTGELINRLSADTVVIGRSITENLSEGLRALAQASAGVGMMVFVSPHLAMFVLSIVPPLAVVAVIYGKYLRKISKLTQDSLAEATQLAEERIGSIRTVRAFGKEMLEMKKYDGKVDYVLDLAYKEAFAEACYFSLAFLSNYLIVLAVLYKGGLLTGAAHMTVGELSSFLMYAFWVGISIGGLSSFYSELMKGFGAGSRIWELLDRKPLMPFNEGLVIPPEKFCGSLEFRDVSFVYPSRPDAPIFQGLNLSVPSGSVMAVVGPSGSGKSTLVSLLLRLYDPSTGSIHIDDHNMRHLNPLWLRSKIGTVSQEPVLFSCSISENIAYGAEDPSTVTQEQIRRVAEVANATEFIENFPKGFDTVVGEKGALLSGGQKQRIAIARALLRNPQILLLDEATSALDAENESLVQEALDRLMEGRTVLIIAHRLSTIQNADAVAVLDQGRVVECGKHAQLLQNPNGLFSKLMEKQSSLLRTKDSAQSAP